MLYLGHNIVIVVVILFSIDMFHQPLSCHLMCCIMGTLTRRPTYREQALRTPEITRRSFFVPPSLLPNMPASIVCTINVNTWSYSNIIVKIYIHGFSLMFLLLVDFTFPRLFCSDCGPAPHIHIFIRVYYI